MKAIQIISQDVFDKVRSRFENLEMGDETGAVTIDPAQARFFDFDFVQEGVDFGRVSISLNDAGSLKVYYSQGITENIDDAAKEIWYNFLKEMRLFAMRRLLRFDTRDVAKTNLDKNDFQQLATNQGPKEEEMTTMNESRWNSRNTKKTSRAVRGATEVIVRHHSPVDEMYPGARSQRKNIKAIFIQNRDGERFKYPFIHPAGAFAMAQHVDHGGIPHDPAGKAIIKMSEEIAQLQQLQKTVHGATLHDDATGIMERAIGRLNELKSQIDSLSKRQHYESWMAEFNEQEHMDDGLAMDAVTMEEYKQKFTQTDFREELAQFFPLLHRIMSETNKIDLDDYVKEEHRDIVNQLTQESPDEFNQFEQWAEAVEQGTLTPDQVEDLKKAIDEMKSSGDKLDYETAYNFFNEFGIESEELEQAFEQDKESNPEGDPMETFIRWAEGDPTTGVEGAQPGLVAELGLEVAPEEEPAAEPQPAPAAQEPVQPAPAAPEQPAAENDEMDFGAGSMPTEGRKQAMIKMIAERVKSFYNASNESVGPFRAPENVALDVKKEVAEKFGEAAGDQAHKIAEAFIEKLTQKWHDKHGPVEDDGFSIQRLKELVGNIKQKVEEISDETTNIMPAEEIDIDPKKAEIPAYKRKQEFPVQQAAQAATKDRNEKSGAAVWRSARAESTEMESILKLAGLAK